MAEGLMISQAEYARRRGFSKQYVGQLVGRGRIVLVDGMVDATAADQAMAQHHDPARYATRPGLVEQAVPDPAAPGLQHSFAKARTIREHFRAMREKLDYEATTGSLIPRDTIEQAASEAGRIVREEVMAAAGPAAAEIARHDGAVSEEAVQAVILDYLRQALHRAADRVKAQGDGLGLEAAAGATPITG